MKNVNRKCRFNYKNNDKKQNDFVVEMEHLKKSFGNNHVLRDINLAINKGENLVILGKSGTGKSVLIKCIVGLVESMRESLLYLVRIFLN